MTGPATFERWFIVCVFLEIEGKRIMLLPDQITHENVVVSNQ